MKGQKDWIHLQGIQTHNLKNIDLKIPKNKIITITGLSGSGKSSLAFDSIYKEGQYKYIESLSSYLKHFFNLGAKPKIASSQGLSPAIAIEQNKSIGNKRSTVGTLTEIDNYLRLLFSKLGDIYCYNCGKPIESKTIDSIVRKIDKKNKGDKIHIIQEIDSFKSLKKFNNFFQKNKEKVNNGEGFLRYIIQTNESKTKDSKNKNKESIEIGNNIQTKTAKNNDKGSIKKLNKNMIQFFYLENPNLNEDVFPIKVYGIYDRITLNKNTKKRLKEDIIKILNSEKKFGIYNTSKNEINRHTDKNFCPDCNISYPQFTAQHFSPNKGKGACKKCEGTGTTLQVDVDKVINNTSPYLEAVLPWRRSSYGKAILNKLAKKYEINKNKKRNELPDWFRDVVKYGDEEQLKVRASGKYFTVTYKGIEQVMKKQHQEGALTTDFQTMLEEKPCPGCNGAKLRKESLNVYLIKHRTKTKEKLNIHDLQTMPIKSLVYFLNQYKDNPNKPTKLIKRIIKPLIDRTKIIKSLGMEYLNTYRRVGTLSGGEIQRLRLAKQLGNQLSGIIYVLDEPTIGLDTGEIKKAIKAIKGLKDLGNTIIVVEHNEAFIENSDRIVEVGPYAGDFGGEIVFSGPYKDFAKSNCLTAQYLRNEKSIKVNFEHTPDPHKYIKIKKAFKHNLNNISVNFQLGSFTIITGPSGSGKTTLMFHILYKFLQNKDKHIQSYIRMQLLKQGMDRKDIVTKPLVQEDDYEHHKNIALQNYYKDLGVEDISGHHNIDNVLYIDQSSIGRTPRSCPVTYIKAFDNIRELFAGVEKAKMMSFSKSHFSFNSKKGRCPECKGYGYKKVKLQFLPDTYITCNMCNGQRYRPEVLDIKWRGKSMGDILNMYIKDAYELFKDLEHIAKDLKLLCDIGLGYLQVGQPAPNLSGGESQRLKLVKNLLKSYRGHTVYFLDEPTVGLHPQDIEKLLKVLKKFLNRGDSIFMIEHEKSLLKHADNVIKLDNGNLIKK